MLTGEYGHAGVPDGPCHRHRRDDPGARPQLLPGLDVEGEWPSLGMRESDTAKLVLRDVEVDDRLVFHRGPADVIDENVISGMAWFAVLLTATYHGVLSGLLDVAYRG
ncbi:hypothetical protein NKH77_43600 [Streptomyces sp. M19]